MSKVQSKNAILFDVVNDAGPLHDALVDTIGEATTTEPGLMAGADKEKLDGIAAGSTANATNSELRDRTTHTGEQAISTITGLVDALAEKATAAQGTKADTAVQPGAAVSVLAETSIAKIMSGDERTKLGALPDNASLSSALAERIALTEKGVANGVATLGADSKVPAGQLPSYVDDVLEYADYSSLPATGEAGKIYVTLDTNNQYRWAGSSYVEIVASPGSTDEVAEGVSNLYHTAARVRDAVLTGLSVATNAAIAATDTVLTAMGKLQAQVTTFGALASSAVQPADPVSDLAETSTAKIMSGDERTKLAALPDNAALTTSLASKFDKTGGALTGSVSIADAYANIMLKATTGTFPLLRLSGPDGRGYQISSNDGGLQIDCQADDGATFVARPLEFTSAGVPAFNIRPSVGGVGVALQSELTGSTYKGTWNATTNSPAITAGVGTTGDFYITSVAGTQSITGSSELFSIGDQVRFNGTAWQRIPNFDAVNSVFGRTGAVVSANGDYNATQITYGATTVALALDAKAALASPALTGIPTAPTAAVGTDTTQIATMAAIKAAIDDITIFSGGTF